MSAAQCDTAISFHKKPSPTARIEMCYQKESGVPVRHWSIGGGWGEEEERVI